MSEIIASAKKITKIYKNQKVLDNIDLVIKSKQIHGLIGRNGAGKTTIMKILSGLAFPTQGELELFSKQKKDLNAVLKQVEILIEHPGLFPEMSAYENLKAKCLSAGCFSKQYVYDLLKLVGIKLNDSKKAVKNFSLGMKQRLGIAIALVGEPKLLILDEPMNGLDPQGFREVSDTLVKLNEEKNITILISSHILEKLANIATYFTIIDNGKIIASLSKKELNEKLGETLELTIADSKKASEVLEENYKNIRIEIVSSNILHVKLENINKEDVLAKLSEMQIKVQHYYQKDISLEEYFLKLTSAEVKHV
ncbi:MAG: ABC transporter ATP-binding protein [Streptococcaceae bacterium]|jgi:ABC-2 type transport system ATP-binding protein|nr:ABC transporter ATP-binding protein [Streptococcaceae bacterium]